VTAITHLPSKSATSANVSCRSLSWHGISRRSPYHHSIGERAKISGLKMADTTPIASSEASTPPSSATEQARIRKERREAKIRAGGSARLNKIAGLGGGVKRGKPAHLWLLLQIPKGYQLFFRAYTDTMDRSTTPTHSNRAR
jgi:hypothetical protein